MIGSTKSVPPLISLSNVADGSMSKGVEPGKRDANRNAFLAKSNVSPDQTVLVGLTYDTEDFCRYQTVNLAHAGDGITRESSFVTDALFTEDATVALFLPLADCIGAVLYDPVRHVLGLSHLGRHNLLQHGGTASVRYMHEHFGSSAHDIAVWLSPAAGKGNYPLFDFDGRSLHEVATEQLLKAGVARANITVDSRDTTASIELFSHSEFLKGNRPINGRHAVVTMMRS